jgi:hypothetical protein
MTTSNSINVNPRDRLNMISSLSEKETDDGNQEQLCTAYLPEIGNFPSKTNDATQDQIHQ